MQDAPIWIHMALDASDSNTGTEVDQTALIRALRRLVYTDKLLPLEMAWAYCDIVGIPRNAVAPKAGQ